MASGMRRLTLIFGLFTLLAACSPFVTQAPPEAPHPLDIAFTATTRPSVEGLHQCALEHPEIGLITQETSITNLESSGADMILWFGEPPQGDSYQAYTLGTDELVMIGGANVTLQNLGADQLLELYGGSDSAYQVWTYGEDNELQDIFDTAVLGGASTSPDALLAPNPAAMIEAISADPMAIGYLPMSWLTGDVQRISIDGDLQAALTRPILILTHAEPDGHLHSYLVCLQKGLTQ